LKNNTDEFYVEYFNETRVVLHQYFINGTEKSNTPVTCDLQVSERYSQHINASAFATLDTTVVPCTIDMVDQPSSNSEFDAATWQSVSMTVRNLNIADSAVWRVAVNDIYAMEWLEESNIQGNIDYDAFDLSGVGLVVPAQEFRKVVINYTDGNANQDLAPQKSDQLKITILSPAGNFFTLSDQSPSPIVQVNTEREDYSVTSRDVIVMDGTDTSFADGEFAKAFIWRIDIPQNDWNGNWDDSGNLITKYLRGGIAEYRPESLFTEGELLPSESPPDPNDDPRVAGPIRVSLKVVDEKGLVSRSETIIVAGKTNI
jgi:hypothetical protein